MGFRWNITSSSTQNLLTTPWSVWIPPGDKSQYLLIIQMSRQLPSINPRRREARFLYSNYDIIVTRTNYNNIIYYLQFAFLRNDVYILNMHFLCFVCTLYTIVYFQYTFEINNYVVNVNYYCFCHIIIRLLKSCITFDRNILSTIASAAWLICILCECEIFVSWWFPIDK